MNFIRVLNFFNLSLKVHEVQDMNGHEVKYHLSAGQKCAYCCYYQITAFYL